MTDPALFASLQASLVGFFVEAFVLSIFVAVLCLIEV
jgi:hypothetical protein